MKDLQKAIEEIVRETMQEVESLMKSTPPNFAYNEVMNTIYKQQSTKLTQLITSREQEIREEAAQEFLEWYAKDYPDGVWRDGAIIMREYLAQQKENK